MATSVAGAQDIGNTNVTVPGTGSTAGVSGGSVTDTAGATDHSVVLNRLGVRYFGSAAMPSLALGAMGAVSTSATGNSLHTVGARYWLSSGLALEGGIAFGISSGSSSTTRQTGGTTTSATSDDPNFFGIGIHAGVPIAIAESKHLTISIVPYLSLHYGRSSITTGSGNGTTDNTLSTVQFRVGGNITSELQFGFLGIPQLGLQAQLGLGLTFNSNTAEAVVRSNNDTTRVSSSNFGIATTVGPNYSLADIITGSISAVYYFGSAPGSH